MFLELPVAFPFLNNGNCICAFGCIPSFLLRISKKHLVIPQLSIGNSMLGRGGGSGLMGSEEMSFFLSLACMLLHYT